MADTGEQVDQEHKELIEYHDRDFQRFSVEKRIYCVPVDEEEEDRLNDQYFILQRLFDGHLFFAPIQYPLNVLDCGYGRGQWACSFGATYDQSKVTAVDIFPAEAEVQETDNVDWWVWDLNETLPFRRDSYDLVHSRLIALGIQKSRWTSYLRDIRKLLKKNGWVQLVEFNYIFQSDNGSLTDDHALSRWREAFVWCMENPVKREIRAGRELRGWLESANFAEVSATTYNLPIGGWHTDPKYREIGRLNVENMSKMIESLAIYPFTQFAQWPKDRVDSLIQAARMELNNASLKLYMPL
ncbi:S-adenosyl-L-methionine-dependent methyltransferase [Patellaria atrata CBS 101060]|uniref:S-adenosyl-L-methionine-dependent methyltransferase n=1 Tax=Patellaria atrata CBS 101060 TaxID=1346257 RepID=A0A9P4S4Q9_9PEZI|nr:S-adenosyl-L-methionine-dependent methyltransferase [Patellaria atrata CBS 101060]